MAATGADTMTGGVGNDTYLAVEAADTVVEARGRRGTDTVQTAQTAYVLDDGVENLLYTNGAAADADFVGTGNGLNNRIESRRAATTSSTAGPVPTSWSAAAANDTYTSHAGDTVTEAASGGKDTVRSTATNDHAGRQRGDTCSSRAQATSTAPATASPTR